MNGNRLRVDSMVGNVLRAREVFTVRGGDLCRLHNSFLRITLHLITFSVENAFSLQ